MQSVLEQHWAGVDVRSDPKAVFALDTHLPAQRDVHGIEYASSLVSTEKPFLVFEKKEVLLAPPAVAETLIATGLATAYLLASCQHLEALRETRVPQSSQNGELIGSPEGNVQEERANGLVRSWGFDPLLPPDWREALVYAYQLYPWAKMSPEELFSAMRKEAAGI